MLLFLLLVDGWWCERTASIVSPRTGNFKSSTTGGAPRKGVESGLSDKYNGEDKAWEEAPIENNSSEPLGV
ncbi:MAG: hypothetical protein J6S27_01645 [Thermoguttaceae bacterium]|nr:hypothetical protein [Thermoguttaceae bacterium]